MVEPLIRTKIGIPPLRAELVARPQLLARLEDGLSRRLTLVSAPAGFGKTTLLASWARSLDHPVAWLSIDEADNDPARFWSYAIAALGDVLPGLDTGVLSAAHSRRSPSVTALLAPFVNALAYHTVGPAVLVLDDYHLISAGAIHTGLQFLVEHLPARIHLVVAGRADPPLPLARLRARDQLVEIRQADLRFSAGEAADFLGRVMRLELGAGEAAALADRTEGWVAGLQMAALSLQSQAPPRRRDFAGSFSGSHRHVLDYLVEEVLERQPAGIQAFLLRTAILRRMTGPLCDALLVETEEAVHDTAPGPPGSVSGEEMLAHFERANLFVVPLDERREWYRYHQLFADLLRLRLARSSPQLVVALHRRAGAWFEAHNLPEEAIEHALEAGDFDRAAGLLQSAGQGMLARSETATFAGWAGRLPHEVFSARPELCVLYAWALVVSSHSLEEATALLQPAERHGGVLAARAAAVRSAGLLLSGQLRRSSETAFAALEALPQEEKFFRSIAGWAAVAGRIVGSDLQSRARLLESLAEENRTTGNLTLAVSSMCALAEVWLRWGRADEAGRIYAQALALATRPDGQCLPVAGRVLVGLAGLHVLQGDLEDAEREVSEGLALTERWSMAEAIDGYLTLAEVRRIQRDVAGAEAALDRAAGLASTTPGMLADDLIVDLFRAQVAVKLGDVAEGVRWAERRGLYGVVTSLPESPAGEDDDSVLLAPLRKYELLLLARIYLAEARHVDALALLGALLPVMESDNRVLLAAEVLVLQALAHRSQGRRSQALGALAQALELAERGRLVRLFADEGPPMVRLLYEAAAEGIHPVFARQLMAHCERHSERSPSGTTGSDGVVSQPSLVEPLSARELEVLRLIAEGLSNDEIARRLIISLATVKVHTRNLYGKLDVNSRMQAVARGRALGLLA